MRTIGDHPDFVRKGRYGILAVGPMDEDVRRQLIGQRIREEGLPLDHLVELGHGRGIGQACDGCGETIATDQRMTVRICSDDWRTVRLHDECFQIWDGERSQIDEREG
jgi:hypothetical protein